MKEDVLEIPKKELLERLNEVCDKQKNSKTTRIIFFIIEMLISFFILMLILPSLEIGVEIVFALFVVFALIHFYIKVVRSPKRELVHRNLLEELVERIENFKDYKAGKANFNLKKELDDKQKAKLDKVINKYTNTLLKVSKFFKVLPLLPINSRNDEFASHRGALGVLLRKLKHFQSSNRL